jgi:hypothetical protein
MRKHLSTPGLLKAIRLSFATIPDPKSGCPIPLVDALMSGLAVFGLKYPSLLKFDEAYQNEEVIRANLKSLYGVAHAPCDTQLRTRLDPIDPEPLRSAFAAVHRQLQRGKALEDYPYWEGHYLVSIDGTGQRHKLSAVLCPKRRESQRKLLPSVVGSGDRASGSEDGFAADARGDHPRRWGVQE